MTPDSSVTRLPSSREELVEEALAEVYRCVEEGTTSSKKVREILDQKVNNDAFQTLESGQYISIKDDRVSFTPKGNELGSSVIRRLRISERLLVDVLNIKIDAIQSVACQFEHVLSKEVSDSICTLLGHPKRCPHDRLIPQGECCRTDETLAPSVVISLDKLDPPSTAKVAYLLTKDNPELVRLLSLGVVPGQQIRLIQRVPTFVVQVGESQIAFDSTIARDIFIRK